MITVSFKSKGKQKLYLEVLNLWNYITLHSAFRVSEEKEAELTETGKAVKRYCCE